MVASLGFKDLKVYRLAFNLAMEIFHESKKFPSEEKYSLTDQIRRASRSVAGNIGEGYRKKQYPKMFASKMADADGEATETQVWLDFANACGYLSQMRQLELSAGYEEVGRMLGGMIAHQNAFVIDILVHLSPALPPAVVSSPALLLPPAPASCPCLLPLPLLPAPAPFILPGG